DTCETSSGSAAGECFPHETGYFGWASVAPISSLNCDDPETNLHVVSECVVTRPFWRVVRASFQGLGVVLYLLRGRCPSGFFACLLLAASEYVLWRNRCCAVGQGRRLGAVWPLLLTLR
ncbi:uncharacterized protein ISCGN_006455, partial [Ixodes scapularis]